MSYRWVSPDRRLGPVCQSEEAARDEAVRAAAGGPFAGLDRATRDAIWRGLARAGWAIVALRPGQNP
jgi:hypothetical protein